MLLFLKLATSDRRSRYKACALIYRLWERIVLKNEMTILSYSKHKKKTEESFSEVIKSKTRLKALKLPRTHANPRIADLEDLS